MRAFISYSVADREFGLAAKQALEDLGIDGFLAHQDIKVSEQWRRRILEELRKVDLFVALLSQRFKNSEWCAQELGFICSREIPIVPLMLDETLPYGLIEEVQGIKVHDTIELGARMADLFFSKYRNLASISKWLERVRHADNTPFADASLSPLQPILSSLSRDDINAIVEISIANKHVHGSRYFRDKFASIMPITCWNHIDEANRRAFAVRFKDIISKLRSRPNSGAYIKYIDQVDTTNVDDINASTLSARERQVFSLIGDGHSTRQIASILGISHKTVDSYREHITLKLNIEKRDLNRAAIRWRRTSPDAI